LRVFSVGTFCDPSIRPGVECPDIRVRVARGHFDT